MGGIIQRDWIGSFRGILLILGALVALYSVAGAAQGLSFSLSSPPRDLEIKPVDLATLVFQLSNNGPQETFQLEINLPAPLQLISPLAPVTLGSGESESIFVTVLVPQDSRAGRLVVTLDAISQSDSSKRASAAGAILIQATAALAIEPDRELERDVEPGEVVLLHFNVINEGNTTDRFVLSIASRQGVEAEIDNEVLELLPGEERQVAVRIRISGNARSGISRVRLIGRSVTTDQQFRSDIELNVLPALPNAVQSNITLGIPSSFSISISGEPSTPVTLIETLSGSGAVTRGATVSYIFQLMALDLDTFRIRYENSLFAMSAGDITFPLSLLINYKGRGGSVTAKGDPSGSSQATIATAVDSDSDLVFGGLARAAIGDLIPHLGARIVPSREEILASAGATLFFSSLGNLVVEGALSRDSTTFDHAVLLQQRADIANLAITSEFIRAGTDFLGTRADEFGIGINQIFGVQGVSVQASFNHSHNNVNADPGVSTIFETEVGTSVRVPLTATTNISSQFNFSSTRDSAMPLTTDLRSFLILGRITQQIGRMNLSVIFESNRSEDLIVGTDTDHQTFQSITELGLGPLTTQFRISLIRELDLVTDTVVAEYLESRLGARIQVGIAQLSLNLARTPGATNISANIAAALGNFSLTSNKSLGISDMGDFEFKFALTARIQFQLPVPLVRVRSRVEGTIYVDENENGKFDLGEPGVANAIVKIGDQTVRTDELGFYRSGALEPGIFDISLQSLPTGYMVVGETSHTLGLKTGAIQELNIPVAQRGFIRGTVFEDLNEDGIIDVGELGVHDVRVVLTGADGFVEEKFTSVGGQFSFNVPDGEYTLSVDPESLPRLFQFTTESEIAFAVVMGEIQEFDFGAREVLEFRFAPEAAFAVMPEAPKAGQVVTFNGSLSLDTDGRVVSYAWDFDGDGEVDATGDVVSYTFTEPGEYEVTLTVTDDDNQQDSETKVIVVGGE